MEGKSVKTIAERDVKAAIIGAELRNKNLSKLAIWINGNGTRFEDTIQGAIYEARATMEHEADRKQDMANSFKTKTRNGKEYWYRWGENKNTGRLDWLYVCPVSKGDPRIEYQADAEKINDSIPGKVKLMESCVIKELGKKHLLIDLELYKKHIWKRLPDDLIMLKEVISW